jgi:hypothetical protein
MPPGRIEGPSAWYGPDMAKSPDLANSEEWLYRLTGDEIAELDQALEHTRARGLDIIGITREDFPLPRLGPVLDDIHRELLHGRGFVLLRGVPVGRYSIAEAAAVYWGIGAYFGRALSQNAKGHVLGHVRDLGYNPDDPNVRIYQTTERQYFHTDSCDLVGLLCLRQARSGGLSAIVSSVTVFNEMLARRPDLLPVLFEPFETDRRGEVPAGMKPYFAVPVFNWHAGRLSTIYVRRYIESARRFPEVPPLTARQVEALDGFDSLLEDSALNLFMDFEPGDIQLLHNHQILHDRTGYVDWPEPPRKRHLLRLWLCPPDGRPLPDCFAPRYGSVEIGRRGGILVPGTRLTVPLEPC